MTQHRLRPIAWPFPVSITNYQHPNEYNSIISLTVLDELRAYRLHTGHSHPLLDDNLRMVAFNLVRRHQAFYRTVCIGFDLVASKHLFVPKLHELSQDHMYKEACQWAVELELFDAFDNFIFVVPLIMQDKAAVAEEFLKKAVQLQRPLIVFLDSLLDRSSSIQNRCSEIIW